MADELDSFLDVIIDVLHAHIPENKCSHCGTPLNSTLSADLHKPFATPRVGDLATCMECWHMMIFTEGLGLREPTFEEAWETMKNPSIQEGLRRLRVARGEERNDYAE